MLKAIGVLRGFEAKEKINDDGSVTVKNKVIVEEDGFKMLKIGVKENELNLFKKQIEEGKIKVGQNLEIPVRVGSYKDYLYYNYAG